MEFEPFNKNIGSFLAFSEEWFDKHQRKLLWLLNTRHTKRIFRFILRIRPHDIPLTDYIFGIHPNRFDFCPRLINGHLEYKTDFRTHPKYAKRLYYAFKPLWWAMHAWDWGLADRFPSFEQLSFGFDTLTQYPGTGSGGTTADTYFWNSVAQTTWASVHDASACTAIGASEAYNTIATIYSGTVTNNYQVIARYGATFDTSSIPSTDIVTDATFSLYGKAKADPASITMNVAVVSYAPTSSGTPALGDYSKFGTTDYATRITYAGFSTSAYNDWTLNTTGKSAIATGVGAVTKIGVRNGQYDADNVAPTWASNANNYFQAYYADQTGTTNDPKLVVTYSVPASTQTQSGKSNISPLQTQIGKGSVIIQSTQNQDGQSRVASQITQNQSGVAKITAASEAWLKIAGTDFTYRSNPIWVANNNEVTNRRFTFQAPLWHWKNKGYIQQSNYEDVHVTLEDGITEIGCTLNTAKNQITVGYPSMPTGRHKLFVYIGHPDCSAPSAPVANYTSTSTTTLDGGFDSRASGDTIDAAIWGTIGGTVTYSHSQPRTGSSMEVKVVQPASTWSGIKETSSQYMEADGSAVTFWTYIPSGGTGTMFEMYDQGVGTQQAFYFYISGDGTLLYYSNNTDQPVSGVYTHPFNAWRAYKIVYNFSSQTVDIYYSTNGTSWTKINSAGLAFRFNPGDIYRSHGIGLGFYSSSGLTGYLDDVSYIVPYSSPAPQVMKCNTLISYTDFALYGYTKDCPRIIYAYGDDLDMTYLNSANADTYYGAGSNMLAGKAATGAKYHTIIKHLDGVFLKGTVTEVNLYLNVSSATNGGTGSNLKLHRIQDYGTWVDTDYYVPGHTSWIYTYARTYLTAHSGWTNNSDFSLPTWNTRVVTMTPDVTMQAIAWDNAGIFNEAGDICKTEGTEPEQAFSSATSTGYISMSVPTAWFDSWQGDYVNGGMLLKATDETVSGYLSISANTGNYSPVLEVYYSSVNLTTEQLINRKFHSNNSFSHFAPATDRHIILPSENLLGVIASHSSSFKEDIFLVAPDGQISRCKRDIQVPVNDSTGHRTVFGLFGINYDTEKDRYWMAGTDLDGKIVVWYSAVGDPTSWSAVRHASLTASKATTLARGDKIFLVLSTQYLTFYRVSNTYGTPVDVFSSTFVGSKPKLATQIESTDVMNGSGVISIDATTPVTVFPPWGAFMINSEAFYYTGRNDVANTFTGVTRAKCGTSAATHTVGTICDGGDFGGGGTYTKITPDDINNCFYVGWVGGMLPNYGHTYNTVLKHGYADNDDVWKDVLTDSTLTVPLNYGTMPIVGIPGDDNFSDSMLYTSQGHLLLTNSTFTQESMSNNISTQTNVYVFSLLIGDSSWTSTLLDTSQWITEPNLCEVIPGYIKMVGLGDNTSSQQPYTSLEVYSEDDGITWGDRTTRTTHSFYDSRFGLWYSNGPERGNLGGSGIMGYSRAAYGGGAWLDSIYFYSLQNQTGISTIAHEMTKTQDGLSRISIITDQTQDGLSRINGIYSGTQDGMTRVTGIYENTQDGVSRITAQQDRSQYGVASVLNIISKTQDGKARVTGTVTQTQSGKGNISGTTTKIQGGKANITSFIQQFQTGKAAVLASVSKTQTGVSRIGLVPTQTQTGVSRISVYTDKTQDGKSYISIYTVKTQSGLSKIVGYISQTQSGKADIVGAYTRTQTGLSSILNTVLNQLRTYWTENETLDTSAARRVFDDPTAIYDDPNITYDEADFSLVTPINGTWLDGESGKETTSWTENATLDASVSGRVFDDTSILYDDPSATYDGANIALEQPTSTNWTIIEP